MICEGGFPLRFWRYKLNLHDNEKKCLNICVNHYIDYGYPIKLNDLMHEMSCSMHLVTNTLLKLINKNLIYDTDRYQHAKTVPTFLKIEKDFAKMNKLGLEL